MTTDTTSPSMTSSQPYLVRAIYEWIVDNDLTPYLLVDGSKEGVMVPDGYLDEQQRIILNISPTATSELLMNNDEITFTARFSGQAVGIVVPTYCVLAIYARENGQGMLFNENDNPQPPPKDKKLASVDTKSDKAATKRPTLKVVK